MSNRKKRRQNQERRKRNRQDQGYVKEEGGVFFAHAKHPSQVPKIVRWFIMAFFNKNLEQAIPFKNGDRKILVFTAEAVVKRAMIELDRQARADPSLAGMDPGHAMVCMGQEKWEMFQVAERNKFVECHTWEDFQTNIENLRNRWELESRHPNRN